MPDSKLAIVLPCYNPLANWAQNLVSTVSSLQAQLPGINLQVYLVNDGSQRGVEKPDLELLQKHIAEFTYVQYNQNRGKGFALRQGVQKTTAELCIYTDIDFPYTQESFLNIYHELKAGTADIAVGVRDEEYYATVPTARVRISKTLRFFAQKLLYLPVNDTQAGLKGFNRRGREVFLETTIDRYLFDLEFIRKAARQPDIQIKPVKVFLKPGIVFTKMKPKILITESWNLLRAWLN